MSDIFISYAKEDKEKAGLLAKVFEQQGWAVWWDPKIPSGKSWPDVIEEALSITKCVVALWSKTSRESKWVKKEARYADQRSILIPVLIENVEVPFEFDHLQAALLFDWKGQKPTPEIDKLIEDVEAVLGIPRKGQSETEKVDTKKEEVPRQDAIREKVVDKKENVKNTPEKEVDKKVGVIEKRGLKPVKQPSYKRVAGEGKKHESKKQQDTTIPVTDEKGNRLPWLLPAIIVPFIIVVVVLVMVYKGQDSEVDRGGLPGSTGIVEEAEAQKQIYQRADGELRLNEEHTEKEVVKPTITAITKFRPTPDKKLSVSSVKAMLKQHNFFCREYDWSKEYCNPDGNGFDNEFEKQNNGQVVYDNASGLTWQQSGSDEYMTYKSAKSYITKLNSDEFAGYNDWRLPTLEEAMSLMEPEEKTSGLYIDQRFDRKQRHIWTSDLDGASVAWVVYFGNGGCDSYFFDLNFSVRAVR